MITEGLTHPELASVLRSKPFTRSLARIAIHTGVTDFEGGLVVARAETGLRVSPPALAQELGAQNYQPEYGDEATDGSLVLPRLRRQVASFHSHPYLRPFYPGDVTNIEPSEDDMRHMQRSQQHCHTYIAGIIGLRSAHDMTLAIHRATRPLPEQQNVLLEQYSQAYGSDFVATLEERLGIRTAYVPFDIEYRFFGASRALPPRQPGELETALEPLYRGI